MKPEPRLAQEDQSIDGIEFSLALRAPAATGPPLTNLWRTRARQHARPSLRWLHPAALIRQATYVFRPSGLLGGTSVACTSRRHCSTGSRCSHAPVWSASLQASAPSRMQRKPLNGRLVPRSRPPATHGISTSRTSSISTGVPSRSATMNSERPSHCSMPQRAPARSAMRGPLSICTGGDHSGDLRSESCVRCAGCREPSSSRPSWPQP